MTAYPHRCPKCSSAAYVGFTSVKCTHQMCAHRDPEYVTTVKFSDADSARIEALKLAISAGMTKATVLVGSITSLNVTPAPITAMPPPPVRTPSQLYVPDGKAAVDSNGVRWLASGDSWHLHSDQTAVRDKDYAC